MIDSIHPADLQRTQTQWLARVPLLAMLHAQGQSHALDWLPEHADSVGRRSSIDMRQRFA
jgi:hypothetical protein